MGKIDLTKPIRHRSGEQYHYVGRDRNNSHVLQRIASGSTFVVDEAILEAHYENGPGAVVGFLNAWQVIGGFSQLFGTLHEAKDTHGADLKPIGILKITYDPTTGAKSVEFVE